MDHDAAKSFQESSNGLPCNDILTRCRIVALSYTPDFLTPLANVEAGDSAAGHRVRSHSIGAKLRRRFRRKVGLLLEASTLGFTERIRGDHNIFSRPDVVEILNLRTARSLAKAYQVKQVLFVSSLFDIN